MCCIYLFNDITSAFTQYADAYLKHLSGYANVHSINDNYNIKLKLKL